MKKCSSMVWKFFDRLGDETDRCVGVICKLCNAQYKYFGNTTNLRVHLMKKHPIQWEMGQNGNFDDAFRVDDASNQALTGSTRKRGFKKEKNVRYSISVNNTNLDDAEGQENYPVIEIQRVDVLDNSDEFNEDDEATLNMVRQMHAQDSDEEWLDDSLVTKLETPNKRRKLKVKKIKREVVSPSPNHRSSSYYVRTPARYDDFDNIVEEPVKDEFSVFGEYIANKIRKFKTDKTRGNIQQIITTILWQAEYGMYDQADSVKRMLLFTVQDPEHGANSLTESVLIPAHSEEVQIQDEINQSVVSESLSQEQD